MVHSARSIQTPGYQLIDISVKYPAIEQAASHQVAPLVVFKSSLVSAPIMLAFMLLAALLYAWVPSSIVRC